MPVPCGPPLTDCSEQDIGDMRALMEVYADMIGAPAEGMVRAAR